jgi:hypothetical protein
LGKVGILSYLLKKNTLTTTNMQAMRLPALILFILLTSWSVAQSQVSGTPSGMQTPNWVLMMDDPDVNYYSALKEYKEYWKTNPKPVEEEEESFDQRGSSSKRLRREREEREREKDGKKSLSGAELERTEYLKYQSKRFEDWARDVKPWVQENGHVLTEAERAAIQQKQEEELKRQQGK